MTPGPSSSKYFSLATANPKLVQNSKSDMITKLSYDDSSSSSSSVASSPVPSPPYAVTTSMPQQQSSSSSLLAGVLESPPNQNSNFAADANFQRHLLYSTSSDSPLSALFSPTPKRGHRGGSGGGVHGVSPLPQLPHINPADVTFLTSSADPKYVLDIKGGDQMLAGTTPSGIYPSDLMPKIFDVPVSINQQDMSAADNLDISLTNALIAQAASIVSSPKLRQGFQTSEVEQTYVRLTPTSATPDIRLINELQSPPPSSTPSIRIVDDNGMSVRIITESPAPVRLMPDLQQCGKEQQQVRILPRSRIMTTSGGGTAYTAEPVQILPDGQIIEQLNTATIEQTQLDQLSMQPAAVAVQTNSAAQPLQAAHIRCIPQQSPVAATPRTLIVSGVQPIYVPSTAPTENKFVTATTAAAFLPPIHHIKCQRQQLVTVVSDQSLLEHPKPEPPPPPTLYLNQVLAAGGGNIVTLAPSPSMSCPSPSILLPTVPQPPSSLLLPPPPPPPPTKAPTRREKVGLMKKVTAISCFKCNMCGFLGLTNKAVEEHMMMEHDADLSADEEDNDQWLAVAQKEGIKLECPFCPNTFNAEGSRSFRVHVLDDHGVNEAEAEKQFRERYSKRKTATLEFLKKKREEEREERRRSRKDGLEAYVDEQGELRVRNTRRKRTTQQQEEAEAKRRRQEVEVDVSAKEYVAAIDVAKKLEQAKRKGQEVKEKPDEMQKVLIGLSQRHKRKQPSTKGGDEEDDDDGDNSEGGEDAGDIDIVNLPSIPATDAAAEVEKLVGPSQTGPPPKKKVGRPKGSRSIGLTKLKQTNPNINLSEEAMGAECGVEGCAVRLKNEDSLEYHRRCHQTANGGSDDDAAGTVLNCLECSETFSVWSLLAMHLWRVHRVDMELHSCTQCQDFKTYYLTTLSMHRQTHQTERPYLCDDCGNKFKTDKSLRVHQRTKCGKEEGLQQQQGQSKVDKDSSSSTPAAAAAVAGSVVSADPPVICKVCHRDFKNMRRLGEHMASVVS
jgi:hypothetical protein